MHDFGCLPRTSLCTGDTKISKLRSWYLRSSNPLEMYWSYLSFPWISCLPGSLTMSFGLAWSNYDAICEKNSRTSDDMPHWNGLMSRSFLSFCCSENLGKELGVPLNTPVDSLEKGWVIMVAGVLILGHLGHVGSQITTSQHPHTITT